MATVYLESYDSDVTDLPDLCMKCGAPSLVRKKRTFSWYPPWVGVLLLAGLVPFVIVAVILTKRCRVVVPLCEQHKNHWLMRQLLVLLSLLGILALGFAATLAVGAASKSGSKGDDLFGLVCMGWVFLLIGWVVLAVIVQSTSIRPKEITDTSIRLTSVSEEFARACAEEMPRSRERLDRLARERWNQAERRPRRLEARPIEDFERAEEEEPRRPPPDAYRE